MLTRRTVIATAALLPVAYTLGATAAAQTLPDTVKSHKAPYPKFGAIERLDPRVGPAARGGLEPSGPPSFVAGVSRAR